MDFKILLVRRLLFSILLLVSTNIFSQCFEIQSILVDACGGADEGRNEMVRFKVGSTPLNINNLTVVWPNNSWQGVVQNSTTAAKVAQLNADILLAGGCAQILEPPGGILPANAKAILITSFNMNTAVHSFGAISENLYMIFQNNANNSVGHFANFGPAPGARTFSMTFGGTCSGSVVYDRTLLTTVTGNLAAEDGATVNFSPTGVATYTNSGCVAPTPPFSVDAGASNITVCAGTTINLNGSAEGQQSLNWSAVSGNFSSPTTTATNYEVPLSGGGTTVVLTLEATNACGVKITDAINLIVTPNITPDFVTSLILCINDTAPILAGTSSNGITGTWNPATISNTVSGNYIFTPTAGQCASATTLAVTITPETVPDFATTLTLCSIDTPPILAPTSPNGITGTWNPATINATTDGNYVFTPTAGQCATATTLAVTIAPETIPDFETTLTLCSTDTPPILALTSPNGITGTWNPATINTIASGNYVFTPTAGQCASNVTLAVNITSFTYSIKQDCIDNNYLIELVLSPNSSATDYTYSWVNDRGDQIAYNTLVFNYTKYLETLNDKSTLPLQFGVTVTSGSCEVQQAFEIEDTLCGIQNVVSPNGDGKNDDFNLSALNINSITIFNRYGREVYHFRGKYENQWHGQWKNGLLPTATYYYIISNEKGEERVGWIFLSY
ncbi:T9SS type B sorting domain-containing protein [Flavobacterium hercynium]|uniref:Ig-like domain-containing protein n=1 Tax=Flavobacterium hercynium TaxID=387094 RepID=A0A226HNP7_9FLAO|nr:gliding motility-associated C-terminal domain-containing protein [Flavobacterium hercynium]OXA95893.1 hypothetical protein B0A66_01985 [Flavobacterium hercynium]SMP34060.1 gliding motility-associated C-terminal domain-containing protein [Flavobacterium hercynium]